MLRRIHLALSIARNVTESNDKTELKLDAGQSPTLARPDAPLATGVTKISSVDKNNKKGCHGYVA